MNLPRALQRLLSLCPVALGWRQAPTVTEQKAETYQSHGERYTRTQEPNREQLDMTPKPLKLVARRRA